MNIVVLHWFDLLLVSDIEIYCQTKPRGPPVQFLLLVCPFSPLENLRNLPEIGQRSDWLCDPYAYVTCLSKFTVAGLHFAIICQGGLSVQGRSLSIPPEGGPVTLCV